MINITFYNCSDPDNKIGKSLQSLASPYDQPIQGTLKEDTSVTDPVIIIEAADIPPANYAYIAELSRYYYINDITILTTGLFKITMHVDVLQTYATAILTSPCIVAKSSNNYNLYLNDSNYKCQQVPKLLAMQFPTGFDQTTSEFVLTLVGNKTTTRT